ncbi:hypothetical protein ACMG5I_03350 [Escherichia coli]|uniref:hypothetical protein n=1 Tax=Escherichia coli TaxID=562 RepID=UPI0039BF6ECA
MCWVNVNSIELNEKDIFAFVNLTNNTVLKGRLFSASDGYKWISLMDDCGVIYNAMQLPQWVYSNTSDDVLAAVMREFEKLPGGDMKNKVFNAERHNYTAQQLESLAIAAYQAAIKKPECVILKYVPDLKLTLEDMDAFIFTSELEQY